MRRIVLPTLAAGLALAITAPLASQLASARPVNPDRGEVANLRRELAAYQAAYTSLDRSLDEIADTAGRSRDRRLARRISFQIRDARSEATQYLDFDDGPDGGYDDRDHGHDHPWPDRPPAPLSASEFQRLSDQVANARFSEDQVAVVRAAAASGQSFFTVAQVIALMQLNGFDDTRIDIAVALAPRVIDGDHWYQVEGALSFSSSKDKLRQRLGR